MSRKANNKAFENMNIDLLFENAVQKSLTKYGKQVLKQAKDNAPVDTGKLKKSLKREEIDPYTQEIYSDLDYADEVEFGSRNKSGTYFIDRAVQQHKDSFTEDLLKTLVGDMKKGMSKKNKDGD